MNKKEVFEEALKNTHPIVREELKARWDQVEELQHILDCCVSEIGAYGLTYKELPQYLHYIMRDIDDLRNQNPY